MDDSDPSAEALDVMSQFMDVITTFKCKGCEFVCYKQDDLVNHVKAEHLPQQQTTTESVAPDVDVDEDDVSSDLEAANSLMATFADDTPSNPPIDNSYIDGGDLQQISIQTYVNGTATDQVVLVDAGVNRSSEELFPVGGQELFLCGQCNMGFQSIDDCKEHMLQQHRADVENLSAAKAVLDVDTNSTSVGTGTAELPHPTTDGVRSKPTAQTAESLRIADREEMSNGKVSMSTQVVKKKVGRKSKAELVELARKENSNPADDLLIQVSAESAEENTIEEEPEDSSVTYIEIEMPGKRKRRVPKHLTDSYYVPIKTKFMTNFEVEGSSRKSSSSGRNYSKGSRRRNATRAVDSPLKCKKCRARFPANEMLMYHMTTHTNDMDKKTQLLFFKCPEPTCAQEDAIFQTVYWADFKQHAWKVHQIDLGMISCDTCGYKTTVPSKMTIHKQIHGTEKPYTCDVCHKSFKQMAQLKNHSLIHVAGVDIKEKESVSGRHWFVQAECSTCKRTFANQKSLQCHIEAVHDKIKPYACKFCGHTAARKAMMQLHMRTHTGEKPFKCSLCDYVTADHNSMRRHRMRHTGDKPYQCPHCSYACIQAVSLKLHLKSKHPGSDKCFSCSKCPYRSVNKILFTNHMRDHEMGLISESDLVPSSMDDGSIKLGAITDMTDGTANVTQLIISALNAIAPSLTEDGESLPGNIETTVETIANTPEGVKAHKISFQIPATATKNAKTAEVVVQEQTTQPMMDTMDTLQAAALHSDIPTDSLDIDDEVINKTVQQFQEQQAAPTEIAHMQQPTHTNIRIQPTPQGTTIQQTDIQLHPAGVSNEPQIMEMVTDTTQNVEIVI